LAKAEAALAALEPRIPRIIVRLPAAGEAAEVAVDGVRIQPSERGNEIDPGEHQIVVRQTGRRPFEQRFLIASEQRKEIDVRRVPAPEMTRAAAAQPERPSRSRRAGPPTGALIAGGAGLVAVAAGILIRLDGQSDYDAAKNLPTNDPDRVTQGDRARTRM